MYGKCSARQIKYDLSLTFRAVTLTLTHIHILLPSPTYTLRTEEGGRRQVCWFAYRSPWPLSHRDCLYAKYRPEIGGSEALREGEREGEKAEEEGKREEKEEGEGGKEHENPDVHPHTERRKCAFTQSYWTIEDDVIKAKVPSYVRIGFEAMHTLHWVREGEDGGEEGNEKEGEKGEESKGGREYLEYGYIQTSDPKLPLPSFLLLSPQVDILIQEVVGLREAVALREASSE